MIEFYIVLIIILAFICIMTVILSLNVKKIIFPVISVFCGIMIIFSAVLMAYELKSVSQSDTVKTVIPVTEYDEENSEISSEEAAADDDEKPETDEPETDDSSSEDGGSRIVYFTKSGKKYHYSYFCSSSDFYECTLEEAIEMGLEPCGKCVE